MPRTPQTANGLFKRGLRAYEGNDYNTARTYFEQTLAKQSQHPQALWYLACIAVLPEEKRGYLQQLIEVVPDHAEAQQELNRLLHMDQDAIPPDFSDIDELFMVALPTNLPDAEEIIAQVLTTAGATFTPEQLNPPQPQDAYPPNMNDIDVLFMPPAQAEIITAPHLEEDFFFPEPAESLVNPIDDFLNEAELPWQSPPPESEVKLSLADRLFDNPRVASIQTDKLDEYLFSSEPFEEPGIQDHRLYTVGGIVPQGKIYIKRRADEELFENCLLRNFCFVLTARQMGKSSLMVQTRQRLQSEGIRTAIADLTSGIAGDSVTSIDQFYQALLIRIVEQLELKLNVSAWWEVAGTAESEAIRFRRFLREEILRVVKSPLVIFIDEIDSIRSLKKKTFPVDDFFAVIRSMYNERPLDKTFERLTFVLLGVARPSDLIDDYERTPFNIGTRIDLAYFTWREVLGLSRGVGIPADIADEVAKQVLEWTGGHPYLSQKVFSELAKQSPVSAHRVAEVVHRLFLTPVDADNNLKFVSDWLTRPVNRVQLLTLYYRIYSGRLIPEAEADGDIYEYLKLTGIIRVINGYLQVSSRIYKEYFSVEWIDSVLKEQGLITVADLEKRLRREDVVNRPLNARAEAPAPTEDVDLAPPPSTRKLPPLPQLKAPIAEPQPLPSHSQAAPLLPPPPPARFPPPSPVVPITPKIEAPQITGEVEVRPYQIWTKQNLHVLYALADEISPQLPVENPAISNERFIVNWQALLQGLLIICAWLTAGAVIDFLAIWQISTLAGVVVSGALYFFRSAPALPAKSLDTSRSQVPTRKKLPALGKISLEELYALPEQAELNSTRRWYFPWKPNVHLVLAIIIFIGGLVLELPVLYVGIMLSAVLGVRQYQHWRIQLQVNERLRYHTQINTEERNTKSPAHYAALVNAVDKLLAQRNWGKSLREALSQTDVQLTPAEYYLLLGLAMFITGIVSRVIGLPTRASIILAFLPGRVIPLLLAARINRYQHQFEGQLPGSLQAFINALRSGYSVLQSFEATAMYAPEPTRTEFYRIVRDVQRGLPLEHALSYSLDRFPIYEYELVVSAMNIQREVGGNLAEILDVISHTVRERLRIRASTFRPLLLTAYTLFFLAVGMVVIQANFLSNYFARGGTLTEKLVVVAYSLITAMIYMTALSQRDEKHVRTIFPLVALVTLTLAATSGVTLVQGLWLILMAVVIALAPSPITLILGAFGLLILGQGGWWIVSGLQNMEMTTSGAISLPEIRVKTELLNFSPLFWVLAMFCLELATFLFIPPMLHGLRQWQRRRYITGWSNWLNQRIAPRPEFLSEIELTLPLRYRLSIPLETLLAHFFARRLVPERWQQAHLSDLQLLNPGGYSLDYLYNQMLLTGIITAGLVSPFALSWLPLAAALGMILLVGGLAGWSILLRVQFQAAQWRTRFNDELLDALDMLLIGVESGVGFDGAMGKVYEKVDSKVSLVFGRILQEIQLGVPRRKALENAAKRLNIELFTGFTAALIQADMLGVSIAKIIRVQSDQIRALQYRQNNQVVLSQSSQLLQNIIWSIGLPLSLVLWLIAPLV